MDEDTTHHEEHENTQKLYNPRKCSSTGKIIAPKDKSSVQININDTDAETGALLDSFTPYILCGDVRMKGEGDARLNELYFGAEL
ncbi:MAG: 40S ribosomal protein S21 [Amphiamblys sp. WSBS2006]|nr:MAG: 40S ribosomal protein S21 [Amphiamblys sp. WSBS2006]